jgi:predicted transcriptional regulator
LSDNTAEVLLEEILDSLLKLDLLVFFQRNPDTLDNPAGIALWVGHDEASVARELAALAQAGLIEAHGVGPDAIYTRTNNPRTVQKLDEFMEAVYSKRDCRLRLIAEIIKREEGLPSER